MGFPGDNLEDYWPDQLLEEVIRQIKINTLGDKKDLRRQLKKLLKLKVVKELLSEQ